MKVHITITHVLQYNLTMGAALTASEKEQASHTLEGLNPAGLTAVIWDSISEVGMDDGHEYVGIQFDTDDAGYSRVVLWDSDGPPLQMPRKVFLEILLFASTEILNKDNVERAKSSDEFERLALAIQHLQQEVDSCPGETAGKYRQLLQGAYVPQVSVEEVRIRRGSWTWANGDADVDNGSSIQARRRRNTVGIEAVVERLPELRKRYEVGLIARIKNKLKAIFLFKENVQYRTRIIPQSIETTLSPTPLASIKLEVINEEEI